MPVAVAIPATIREAILDHCRRELPDEACGLVAGTAPAGAGGRATRWLPARNAHASPHRYAIHDDDLVALTLDVDEAGEVIWAIVHSHVASPAVPSATDIRESRYPDALQIVVSLAAAQGLDGSASPATPALRAWLVTGAQPHEVPITA